MQQFPKNIDTQEKIIAHLRDKEGLRFSSFTWDEKRKILGKTVKKYKEYEIMISPNGDMHYAFRVHSQKGKYFLKFNPTGTISKVRGYSWGKNLNFKKVTYIWKFPKELSYKEREDFRKEYDLLIKEPKATPTKAFREAWPHVKPLNPHMVDINF